MAYLYMNVAVHASLVERAIYSYPILQRLIRNRATEGSDLSICALGGGPGSELLGIVKYIKDLKIVNSAVPLDFVLIDKVTEWDESWHALKSGVDGELRTEFGNNRGKWAVNINRSFLRLDVTNTQDFQHFPTRFAKTDLYIFCYIVSELKEAASNFEQVIKLLVNRAKPDALFLFIDRDEKIVRELVKNIIDDAVNLESLGTVKERGRLQDDLEDLGEWFINIESLPRQKWLAFFALARKNVFSS